MFFNDFFLTWTIFEPVTILRLFYVLIFLASRHVGSWFPHQGLNPCHLPWKCSLNHWTIKEVLLFTLSMMSLEGQVFWILMYSNLLIFSFMVGVIFCVLFKKTCPTLRSWRYFSTLSYKSFIVFLFTVRSMLHLESHST